VQRRWPQRLAVSGSDRGPSRKRAKEHRWGSRRPPGGTPVNELSYALLLGLAKLLLRVARLRGPWRDRGSRWRLRSVRRQRRRPVHGRTLVFVGERSVRRTSPGRQDLQRRCSRFGVLQGRGLRLTQLLRRRKRNEGHVQLRRLSLALSLSRSPQGCEHWRYRLESASLRGCPDGMRPDRSTWQRPGLLGRPRTLLSQGCEGLWQNSTGTNRT